MSIRRPQADLPRDPLGFSLSGSSDLWDNESAGSIITDEFFGTSSLGAQLWIKVSGIWNKYRLWVKSGGVWNLVALNVNDSGTWK